MYFHDVTPGEKWQVESASRYNAVNWLLSKADFPQTAIPENSSSGCRILVRNSSNQTLGIFTAVSPKQPLTGTPGDFSPEERAWDIVPAQNENVWWGVLQQELAPQQCGEAVISGVTLAAISSSSSRGNNWFLAPGENGLEYGACGRGELLGVSSQDSFALICLHGASGYDCIFKIRLLDATHVSVSYGVVVVNGEIREVAAVASLPIVQPCWIYIESSASTDTIRSSSSIPVQTTGNGARGVFPLGKVVSNKVSQYSRGVPTILLIGAECEDESSSGSAEE